MNAGDASGYVGVGDGGDCSGSGGGLCSRFFFLLLFYIIFPCLHS